MIFRFTLLYTNKKISEWQLILLGVLTVLYLSYALDLRVRKPVIIQRCINLRNYPAYKSRNTKNSSHLFHKFTHSKWRLLTLLCLMNFSWFFQFWLKYWSSPVALVNSLIALGLEEADLSSTSCLLKTTKPESKVFA